MKNKIKEILEKPNVYIFGDECYLYFGDYNKLKDYITNLQEENERLKDELETMTFTAKVKQEAVDSLISRIDKAVEYIKEHTDKLKTIRVPKIDFNYNKLLEILKLKGDK